MLRYVLSGRAVACAGTVLLAAGLFVSVALTGCSNNDGGKAAASASAKAKDGHEHSPGDGHDHEHTEGDGHDHGAEKAGHDHEHSANDGHDHTDDEEQAHEHAEGEADGHDHAHGEEDGHDHGGSEIAVTAEVRQNLGITFTEAESRRVRSTLRVPGRFEPLPSAVREYHTALAGRVELLVRQYDEVTTGQPLYRLDSAEWRRMQQELISLNAEVAASSATLTVAQVAREGGLAAAGVSQERIAAADEHIKSVEQSIKLAEEREKQVLRLQELMGGRQSDLNEARSQLAALRNELSQAKEDRAELQQQRLQLLTDSAGGSFSTTETLRSGLSAREAEYGSALARRDLLLASLRSIGGADPLETSVTAARSNWMGEPEITVRAASAGVVTRVGVAPGAFVEAGAEVITVLNTQALRFRGVALQSDLSRLTDSMQGNVLPPGTGVSGGIPVEARLTTEADADVRTVDVVADVPAKFDWVRPGVSTDLELQMAGSDKPVTAVPRSAVIQDGLEMICFRRKKDEPDAVERVEVLLGVNDGRWVEVKSGLAPGDVVVASGVYELKLESTAKPSKAGHFHADGTFHEGKD